MADPQAETMARKFHETYERLAPQYAYETRKESAVPWDQVTQKNRALMIAVCGEIRSWMATQTGMPDIRCLTVDLCRELYDRFVMGGWEPQDAHEMVAQQVSEHMKAAEARNEALLQALKEFLENDGGEGSKCYDASKYCAARKKLRKALDSGPASQEAKTPGGVLDLDLLRELSDPADEYEGNNPPFGGGKLYNSTQVRAMLANFAGQMVVKFAAKGKEK